jgi:hypothetical protein
VVAIYEVAMPGQAVFFLVQLFFAHSAFFPIQESSVRIAVLPVGVPRQRVFINPRLVIEPLDEGGGGELDQVAIAALVFTQQDGRLGRSLSVVRSNRLAGGTSLRT